jgi:arylsulfatase A-like enzyme
MTVMSPLRRLLTLVVVVAVPAVGAVVGPPPPQGLVIVTLDTTRADRLPAYGFASVATPALDRLAREGVVFDQTVSVAPLTLTAHTSLFTGLYPPHHGVRDNADRPLSSDRSTLAKMLHARGFRTAAFVGSRVLAPDRGLAQGFDVYSDGSVDSGRGLGKLRRPANEVVDQAVAWLDAGGSAPFFLWVHLYDAHAPQTLPDDYRRVYGGDLYAGAIAFADTQLGRLIAALDRTHGLDRIVTVVAADHGESLGDHGEAEHGIFLYESVLHVPLIVRAPGFTPRRVAGLTSLVDVVPTVRDLFGMATVPGDGVSLVPALRGRADVPERSVYAESLYALRFGWSPLRVLRDGRFKLIDAPRPELYDLDTDPFEEHDLSAERQALVAAMRAGLKGLAGDVDASGPRAADVSPEVRARLAALGYTSGMLESTPMTGQDPKDYIQIFNASHGRR